MPKLKITIYKTPTCPYCELAEHFFRSKDLSFQAFDVTKNPTKGQEVIAKSNQTSMPVIIINKNGQEKIFAGFNQAEIEDFLNK